MAGGARARAPATAHSTRFPQIRSTLPHITRASPLRCGRGCGASLPAMSRNLATILTETAERQPEHLAIKLDDFELNYQLLNEGSARVAGLLKAKGVGSGDRVGIMLPNVPHFAVAYYGVLRAGAVVVPMNVLLKGREVQFYLDDPEAKLPFAWHDFAEAAEPGAEGAGAGGVLRSPGQGLAEAAERRAEGAGAEAILVKPGEFEQMLFEQEADHGVA